MKILFFLSLRIALLNFLVSTLFILTTYVIGKNELIIKGLPLFFILTGIIFFIISVRQLGKVYLHQVGNIILLTSFSIIFLNLFNVGFSLFLHSYIDPNLRYEIAYTSATHFFETIQQIEREQEVTFLFNYDEEVERVVATFEPINMLRSKLISTLINLALCNFLVLITIREQLE